MILGIKIFIARWLFSLAAVFLSGMKITKEALIDRGSISMSYTWEIIRHSVQNAINNISWPENQDTFALNPAKKGNGVTIIKPDKNCLLGHGWIPERTILPNVGPIDALRIIDGKKFILEWETGNIASSYRSMTKLCHAFLKGSIAGAILVIPTKRMGQFLTDRISTLEELKPNFDYWRATSCLKSDAILEVWAIEYDSLDASIPLIPKSMSGRRKQNA